MKSTTLLAFLIFVSVDLSAQTVFPKIYQAVKATEQIEVDGIADESPWQTAPWSDDFVDIEGEAKPLPEFRTRFKMLWDEEALYILAELEEPHIWQPWKTVMILFFMTMILKFSSIRTATTTTILSWK